MSVEKLSFFKKTVNVLLVDDLPVINIFIKELLDPLTIYSLSWAANTREALDIIEKKDRRFHVCLFDLGLDDVDNNELHLLDKFGKHIPFIITSIREDPEKSFLTKERGARAFVKKGTKNFIWKILSNINHFSLLNMLCTSYPDCVNDGVRKCIDVLVNKSPLHVNEWAMEANIQDRQLRRTWEENIGINAKHTLCVYHIFKTLFGQVEASCNFSGNPPPENPSEKQKPGNVLNDWQRFFEYYQVNRQTIDPYIFKPTY